jgi:(p)ppGpp synthase/HD superfamily hydrolase
MLYRMNLTSRIQHAINRAAILHREQTRKDSEATPYIVHLVSVAIILSEDTEDEDTLVAGLLHDVLEDVPNYGEAAMRKEFGDKVTDIVKGVTEDKDPDHPERGLSWEERKDKYLENLKRAPLESVSISAADKIHNLSSLIELYKSQGEDMWKKFGGDGPSDRLDYYGRVLEIVEERVGGELARQLREVFEEAQKVLK